MEKYTRTHDLNAIKSVFLSVEKLGLSITATALRGAEQVGLSTFEIVEVIKSLEQSNFYKSMTSYENSRISQDVYYAKYRGFELYIKFTMKTDGRFLLLSFKEK